MRTTLDIEPDVLQAAKELATRDRTTAGQVISRVFREGIRSINSGRNSKDQPEFLYKNGIRVLAPRDGPIITLDHVRRLMEEEGN